jgi:ribonuclease BN (tRNA processing enzyme)
VDEPLFSVRTVTLDHGTPVQAYAFESKAKLNVDSKRLKTLGFHAGPWLNELKRLIGAGESKSMILFPSCQASGHLVKTAKNHSMKNQFSELTLKIL